MDTQSLIYQHNQTHIHLAPLHVIVNIKYMIYYSARYCEIPENLFNIKYNQLYK